MTDTAEPPEMRRPPRPPHEMAVGYINEAEAYRRAASLVHSSDELLSDTDLIAPALFLLCHATELALKAFLLSHGADPGSKAGGLKNPELGHNLPGLYDLAASHGFIPRDDRLRDMVDWLGPAHRGHSFRYRETGNHHLPLPCLFAEVLRLNIDGIRRTVGMRAAAISRERHAEALHIA